MKIESIIYSLAIILCAATATIIFFHGEEGWGWFLITTLILGSMNPFKQEVVIQSNEKEEEEDEGFDEDDEDDWYDRAVRFDFDGVYIESRKQRNNVVMWAICNGGYVFGKNGAWYYEPLPSSRTDEFLELTRYSTKEEAYEKWAEFNKPVP